MSFEITTIFHNMVILERNAGPCLQALNLLYEGPYFDVVRGGGYETLAAALGACDIHVVQYPTADRGGVVELRAFDNELWNANRYFPLFRAIAPYVDGDQGRMYVFGEFEAIWRFRFRGGAVVGQIVTVDWYDDPALTATPAARPGTPAATG